MFHPITIIQLAPCARTPAGCQSLSLVAREHHTPRLPPAFARPQKYGNATREWPVDCVPSIPDKGELTNEAMALEELNTESSDDLASFRLRILRTQKPKISW
eukprot:gene411-3757_t